MQTFLFLCVYLFGAPNNLIHSTQKISMKFSKRIALAVATLGLTATTVAPVFAATPSNSINGTQSNPRTALIQALAQRFNLNQSDVQSFFDQQEQAQMQAHAAEAQTRLEQRLTTLVTSGKITEAQKTALIAKAKEAQAKHEEARKLTSEECKKMMDAYRTELETWLTQQGLDKSYVRDLMGPGGFGGHGGRGGMMGEEGRGTRGGRGPRGDFGGPMNGQTPQAQNGGTRS